MDIKTVQAESAAKATAWLTQNLQSDAEVALEGKGEPASPTPPEQPKQETPPPPVQPVTPPKPGLADAIRQDREKRTAATAAQTEATKYRGELEALRKENAALKALGAATDPFEFLQHRKLSKEQQALWGQAFLYDLKPEVAPQEFRLELYKAEQARKEAERAAAEERERAQADQEFQQQQLGRYANELYQHVQAHPGSNPESEAWFTEDGPDGQPIVNHRAYAQSLLATADNLAKRAQQTGQQADLSPANIAKVLEAEVAKRMQRRDAKRAGKASTQTQGKPVVPAPSGKQAVDTTTTSAAGLGGGPPLPPAKTPEERAARAAAALFGTK